jgi:hypothetical protein
MVTNIPANMVVDQFGMIGLLTFIRAAETDPNLGRKQTSVVSPLFMFSVPDPLHFGTDPDAYPDPRIPHFV